MDGQNLTAGVHRVTIGDEAIQVRLLTIVRSRPADLSSKTHRPFEHYARPGAWSAEGGGARRQCWVRGQLWVFRPPAAWQESWLHAGSPDMPSLHEHFWPHALGDDTELVAAESKPNLHRLEQWAKNSKSAFERTHKTDGLMAVLVVWPCDPPRNTRQVIDNKSSGVVY